MKKGEPAPKMNGCVAIDIRGAKGLNAETINGIYEPTDEICNLWPVYRKRGDANKWLEFFAGTNKWYVKATTDKGRARGWMRISCDPPTRPEACRSVSEVWDGNKWIPQNSVSIVTWRQRKEEDRIAGAQRLANAVAVDIRGATGPSASSINGVYTPTEEICSGWPVYRKEGDPDKWLEYMITTNEWYVKPTADRGRPEGWMCLGCEPPSPPECSRGLCEVWDGEKWSVQSTVTVLTAACAFENMLEVQIFCAEETRDLQEKLNGVLHRAVGMITSPSLVTAPNSTISDKNNINFCQTLMSVLSSSGAGGSGSSSSAAGAGAGSGGGGANGSNISSIVQALVRAGNSNCYNSGSGANSSSSSAGGSSSNGGTASSDSAACFIPPHRVAEGHKQLSDLLAEIDDRLGCLHDQAEDEEDDEGEGEGEEDSQDDSQDEDDGDGDGDGGGKQRVISKLARASSYGDDGLSPGGGRRSKKSHSDIANPPPPPPPAALMAGSGIVHAINAIPPAPAPPVKAANQKG